MVTCEKQQYLCHLTQSDEVKRLWEADTDKTQFWRIVITVPDQKLSVGSNRLNRPVVDVSPSLECSHVLAFHTAGTVDVAQPVWSARISTIYPVGDTTLLVDLQCTPNEQTTLVIAVYITPVLESRTESNPHNEG